MAQLQIGDIVTCNDMWCRYGVIVGFVDNLVKQCQYARIHYIEAETGKPMQCPDRKRCKHEHTCPIHGMSRPVSELQAFSLNDIELYQQEGLLSADLVEVAKQNHARRPKVWTAEKFANFLEGLCNN